MASGDSVERIKERLSIVDVVSSYVELHPAGKNFKGKSPFTNEKTPSFYVSPDRGMYYCFSSSQGGDIFTFIEKMEGVDFKGALKILADKAGVELVPEDPKKKSERDRQFDALAAATKFFSAYLQKKDAALAYLKDRGVKNETVAKWRIGYAPGPPEHGWRELKTELEGQGFTATELLSVGLIKGADAGKEPYDLFRDRIMFPICDASGRVVAYSGRILTKDSEAPKYVNSPETPLFNKSEILFGYDKAKIGIRHMDFSLIVEGQFDVVMAHQAGYVNAVAVSGTALTNDHVNLLQRLSSRVVLALDNDRAGIAAVQRAADLMLRRGMDVKVARMEGGKDPADMIQKDPADFKKVIGRATHVVEYLLDLYEAEAKDERMFKLQTREDILPYVAHIPNRIDQEHFVGLIAKRLETSEDAIRFEVDRIRERLQQGGRNDEVTRTAAAPDPAPAKSVSDRHETLLTHLVLVTEVLPTEYVPTVVETVERLTGTPFVELQAAIKETDRNESLFTLEQYVSETPPKQLLADLVDQFRQLERSLRKRRIEPLQTALVAAEQTGDEARVTALLQEIAAAQRIEEGGGITIDIFS